MDEATKVDPTTMCGTSSMFNSALSSNFANLSITADCNDSQDANVAAPAHISVNTEIERAPVFPPTASAENHLAVALALGKTSEESKVSAVAKAGKQHAMGRTYIQAVASRNQSLENANEIEDVRNSIRDEL